MRAVLTFHALDASGSVLSFPPDALARLVRGILDSGHAIVPLGQLLEAPEAPARVALTFDDGFASVVEHGLPILRDAGVPATLFLTTGYVGRDNRWPSQPAWAPTLPLLAWDGVEALAAAGWDIEAHSVSHPDLRTLSDEALEAELEGCCRAIQERLGRRPRLFAYPYGRVDERVAAQAARRFRFSVTTRAATLDGGVPDPQRVPRLDAHYLRPAWLQRRFGSGAARRYLALRGLLRRVRRRD